MIAQRLQGERLHLQHGPIDVVLRAWGSAAEVETAERAAVTRFGTILEELVAELPMLRGAVSDGVVLRGAVARRMLAGCLPFARQGDFVTSMAAVAGAVSDELLAAMRAAAPGLRKAFVNDGGDVAVFVGAGETLRMGMVGEVGYGPLMDRPAPLMPPPRPAFGLAAMPQAPASQGRESLTPRFGEGRGGGITFDASLTLTATHAIGGIATSGWQGRSFSLGIADAVTVLARDAATADAAATLIANAVNLDSPAVARAPASALDPDSDLGDRLVTTNVGALADDEITQALDAGLACAEAWTRAGLIRAAALRLQGQVRTTGTPFPALTDRTA